MMDRLKFIVSRGLGPIGNLAILTIVGVQYGAAGVADYTYAMVVCGVMYFVVGLAMQTYVATHTQEASLRREILWIRLLSVAASCVAASVVASLGDQSWFIVAGLWLLKAGEMLFEPVVVYAALAPSDSARGQSVYLMELRRFALVQALIWGVGPGLGASLGTTLAVAGVGNLIISAYYLVTFPPWAKVTRALAGWWQILKEVIAACLPMAVSGAALAAVLGMPRLLLDGDLTQDQRAIMGVAQVGSSVLALFFNAIWVYELTPLKAACSDGHWRRVLFLNTRLSLVYFGLLGASALILSLALTYLDFGPALFHVHADTLTLLLVILSIPHCLSLHRDVLKFLGRAWLEVKTIVVTMILGLLVWQLASHHFAWDWIQKTAAFMFTISSFQVAAAFLILINASGGSQSLQRKEL
jgi:hypothetical protein